MKLKLIYILLFFLIYENNYCQVIKNKYTINEIIDSIKKDLLQNCYEESVNIKDTNFINFCGGYNFIFDQFINNYTFFLNSNFYKNVLLNASYYHDSLLTLISNENFDWIYKRYLLILLQGQKIDKILELIESVFYSVKKFDKNFNLQDTSFNKYLIRIEIKDEGYKTFLDTNYEVHSSLLIDILNQFFLEIYELHKNFKNKKLIRLLDSITDYYVLNKSKDNKYKREIIDICYKIKTGEKYTEYIRKKNILFPPYFEYKKDKSIYNIDFYSSKEHKIPIFYKNLYFKKMIYAYKEVFKKNDIESQLKYFNIFPAEINLFYSTFSYNKKLKLYSPLINEYEKFIDLFFNLNRIPKHLFLDKIFSLTQNASWDVRALEYLNIKMYNFYMDNKKLIEKELNKKSDIIVENFLYFIYDKPYFKSDLNNIKVELNYTSKIEKIRNRIFLKIIKQNKSYYYQTH